MILCVTPNPALDRTIVVDYLVPGGVHRASQMLVTANGKAVNVARAARTFGVPAMCAGFLGGATGKQVAALLSSEGLQGAWTTIANGETRTDTIIVAKHGESTVINESGPTVTRDDWQRLHQDVLQQAENARFVCVCGSLPPGSQDEDYTALLKALQALKRPVWVDASGATLTAALTVPGLHLKINGDEASFVLGRPVDSPEAAIVAAEELLRHGVEAIALTAGKLGAALVTKNLRCWVRSPLVKTVSAVGSGDTFLAGMLCGLLAGAEPKEAARRGAAAGAANAITLGAGRFDHTAFEQILALTAVAEV
jgi:1-phosphofructokinase family hexose kinase